MDLISINEPIDYIDLYKKGIISLKKDDNSIPGLKPEDFDCICFNNGYHEDVKLEVEEFGDTGVYNITIIKLGLSDKSITNRKLLR